jgi:predicted amidohydrolase YtcJ
MSAMNRGTQPADLVFTGGSVMTMDPGRPRAEAVAVSGGRIAAVGTDAEVRPWVGPRTRSVDLAGRTLLPGFQDAHVHPATSGLGLLLCTLHEVEPGLDAYIAAIDTYARANPDRAWVVGDGWYMAAFPGGTPSRVDLDRVVPDRPAFLENRDGHGAWVNSRALELAGITRDTPDPAHGRIERDAAGEPSGTLHESAVDLVHDLIPQASLDDRVAGLRLAQAYLHRLGITAWQEAWVTPEEEESYHALVERGGLTARVVACLWWERGRGAEQIEELIERRRVGTMGRLRSTTVKIMQDGVAENFTAAMLRPYLDADGHPTDNPGLSFVEPELLRQHVTRLDAEGFQIHFHTLGDRAVREALDAIEGARKANGPSDGRHHLAHLQMVDPADFARFRELGATANIQPFWACHDRQMDELTIPFLPPDRVALQYPFGSLQRAGARLAGGSDWSVSTPNVMAEVEVAITRASAGEPDIPPFLPHESLTLGEALAAYTSGSAWVNHLDAETGSIEAGKLADLVVVDRDLFAPDAARDIGKASVLMTLVEGQAVHDTPGF